METAEGPLLAAHPQLVVPSNPMVAVTVEISPPDFQGAKNGLTGASEGGGAANEHGGGDGGEERFGGEHDVGLIQLREELSV